MTVNPRKLRNDKPFKRILTYIDVFISDKKMIAKIFNFILYNSIKAIFVSIYDYCEKMVLA